MTIDWWTIGLQTVNVAILVWLLAHFFWRPVAAMVEQRRVEVQRRLDEAQARQQDAAAALAAVEQQRAEDGARRQAMLEAARRDAAQAREALMAAAATEVTALRESATAAIAADRAAAEAAWSDRAARLAVDVAGRLLHRLDGPTVSAAFLDGLVSAIAALPGPARNAACAGDAGLRLISASPLAEPDQARCRDAVGAALGGRAELRFEVDPSLIAGLELRGSHLVVTNSWRADLARILGDLGHDDRG